MKKKIDPQTSQDHDSSPDASTEVSAALEALQTLTVLYVEDDPYTLDTVIEILEHRVKKLYTAINGQDGLLSFVKFKPDVVVTDILMPKMDGLQMCKAIRSIRRDTPLILTTCMDDSHILHQALELGVSSYVTKPILPPKLYTALGKIAEALRNQHELIEQKRLNELLLNSLPYPAMLLNRDSRQVLSGNNFAVELGISVGDSLNTPFFLDHFPVLIEALEHGFPLSQKMSERLKEIQALGRTWDITLDLVTDNTVLFFAVDISERKAMENKLHKLATTDGLTGLYNRRHFMELAHREFSRAQRYKISMSLLMFDVDHFKSINDQYGHDAGDDVLITLAQTGSRTLRNFDILGRLGGEEFAAVLPETNEETAWIVAERLRSAIEKNTSSTSQGDLRISVSMGICTLQRSDVHSVDDMLRIADKGLYLAKENGRNRVEMLPEEY